MGLETIVPMGCRGQFMDVRIQQASDWVEEGERMMMCHRLIGGDSSGSYEKNLEGSCLCKVEAKEG